MKHARWVAPLLALSLGLLQAAEAQTADTRTPAASLSAFADEAELQRFLAPLRERHRQHVEERRRLEQAEQERREAARQQWLKAHPGQVYVEPTYLERVEMSGSRIGPDESITNNHTAGVDEGGIVKLHGKYLVVLRRGRLFTIEAEHHSLKAVSTVDALAPGMPPGSTWIDEMLIADDTIAVIGYSYGRGGTEIGLFRIDDAGQLSYRSTWHLRSNDYYSARNYASRLVNGKLVLYTPLQLSYRKDPAEQLPALRRWTADGAAQGFERMATASRIYRQGDAPGDDGSLTLHTVISCDIKGAELDCQATGLFGSPSRVFYVSATAVYLWTRPASRSAPGVAASLYRMPLDAGAPGLLLAQGGPLDQFSFHEGDDAHLNVLLQQDSRGDAMWRAERVRSSEGLSLLRVPLSDFRRVGAAVDPSRYRDLPSLVKDGCSLQNRFVGPYLLYGSGCLWEESTMTDAAVNAVPYAAPRRAIARLELDHRADRIEALGKDAVLIGARKQDLVFSTLDLGGDRPRIADRYARAEASQAETRSHGFFYKAQGARSGLIGLPLRAGDEPGVRQLSAGSTAMLYLRHDRLGLRPVGQLDAQAPSAGDGCKVSCVDWYGNARPIFLGERVFALMGYELVEGKVLGTGGSERLVELRRVNFQPGAERAALLEH